MLAFFVVCLIAIPLLSAIAVAVLGPRRADAVRWVSLGSTLLSLLLSIIITWDFAAGRLSGNGEAVKRFEPSMVTSVGLLGLEKPRPDPAVLPAALRFYVGLGGVHVLLL